MTRFRIVRKWSGGSTFYAVETAEPLTEAEALAVLRALGQPYPGQRYPNRPGATAPKDSDTEGGRHG